LMQSVALATLRIKWLLVLSFLHYLGRFTAIP